MKINERIKNRRLELGLSLESVANALGVSKSTVFRYETKEIEKMPIDIVEPLAKVLKVTPAYIMGWEDNIQNSPPSKESERRIFIYGKINEELKDNDIIGSLAVPLNMLPSKQAEYFAQYATDNSMSGIGIHTGDLIIYEKTSDLETGQIGCFCIDSKDTICKKYAPNDGMIVLLSASDSFMPIFVDQNCQRLQIFGKMVLKLCK